VREEGDRPAQKKQSQQSKAKQSKAKQSKAKQSKAKHGEQCAVFQGSAQAGEESSPI